MYAYNYYEEDYIARAYLPVHVQDRASPSTHIQMSSILEEAASRMGFSMLTEHQEKVVVSCACSAKRRLLNVTFEQSGIQTGNGPDPPSACLSLSIIYA